MPLILIWHLNLERVMGIEPTSSAWKAEVLPLNYTRQHSQADTNLAGMLSFIIKLAFTTHVNSCADAQTFR